MGREDKRFRERAILRLKKRWGRDPSDAEVETAVALLHQAQGTDHRTKRSVGRVASPQRPPNAR